MKSCKLGEINNRLITASEFNLNLTMADNKLRPMLRQMDLSVTNCIAESITPKF